LCLSLSFVAIFVAAQATDGPHSSEDADLRAQLDALSQRHSALELAVREKLAGWRRPDEFSMKELNGLLKDTHALENQMRLIFTHIKMRDTEQGLANFRSLLEQSYQDQGFEKDLSKVEQEAKEFYLVIPETVQQITQNWHAKESKDIDSKKIDGFEQEYFLLLHDYNWLFRNSYRPIPDLSKMLKNLQHNRDSLNAWLASPVKGDPKKVFLESGVATVSSTEADAEAETESESESESETAEEADAATEAETDAEVDPVAFAEAEAKLSFDLLAESEADAQLEAKMENEQDKKA